MNTKLKRNHLFIYNLASIDGNTFELPKNIIARAPVFSRQNLIELFKLYKKSVYLKQLYTL